LLPFPPVPRPNRPLFVSFSFSSPEIGIFDRFPRGLCLFFSPLFYIFFFCFDFLLRACQFFPSVRRTHYDFYSFLPPSAGPHFLYPCRQCCLNSGDPFFHSPSSGSLFLFCPFRFLYFLGRGFLGTGALSAVLYFRPLSAATPFFFFFLSFSDLIPTRKFVENPLVFPLTGLPD